MTLADLSRSPRRWMRRLSPARFDDLPLLGDTGVGGLVPVQALHSAGETMFAVSLAGSLFFNVSLDAARPRIVLYLAVTMAPFLVLASVIGPMIDRIRGGHRMVLMVALGGRAVFALLLATQLKGLLFYPQAFAIMVLAKVYSVSRNSLIPVLVTDRAHLVVVNARVARVAAIAGALAAIPAVAVLNSAGPEWVLRVGAIAYGAGALLALRLPSPHHETRVSPVVEQLELSGPAVKAAAMSMGWLRAAIGFLIFHLGFVMKRAGEPTWLFGLLAIAMSLGGFAGTFVAHRLRRIVGEQLTFTIALAVPALVALLTALRFHRMSAVVLSFFFGLGASVARRTFDSVVQAEAPHARRGKAFAGLETRLELGWAAGALLAVVSNAPGWVGAAALAAALGGTAVLRYIEYLRANRVESTVSNATLSLRLLATAEALAASGDRQQALVVALAAVDLAKPDGSDVGPELAHLRDLCWLAATDDGELAAEDALRLAHQLVADAYPEPD